MKPTFYKYTIPYIVNNEPWKIYEMLRKMHVTSELVVCMAWWGRFKPALPSFKDLMPDTVLRNWHSQWGFGVSPGRLPVRGSPCVHLWACRPPTAIGVSFILFGNTLCDSFWRSRLQAEMMIKNRNKLEFIMERKPEHYKNPQIYLIGSLFLSF